MTTQISIDMSQLVTAEDKAAQAAADQAAQARSGARAYLAETDWYVTRKVETGTAIPPEVEAKRAEAREVISATD